LRNITPQIISKLSHSRGIAGAYPSTLTLKGERMKVNRQLLEKQLAEDQEESKSRRSYLRELKEMTAKLGTNKEEYETDQIEAENDAKYYDGEIARLKKELAQAPPIGGTPRQGIGAVVFSSISFVVGALLGSRFKSRKKP
jgi:hypothetical protein